MEPGISYDVEKRPEASNLINIYAALAGTTRDKVVEQFGSGNFSTFKKALTDLAVEQLSPITSLMREYMQDVSYIDKALREGSEKAAAIAEKHMKEIKEIVGFLVV